MQLHLILKALLRLFVGCQARIIWQPGSPIPVTPFATTPYKHQQQRNRRSC